MGFLGLGSLYKHKRITLGKKIADLIFEALRFNMVLKFNTFDINFLIWCVWVAQFIISALLYFQY